MNPSPYTHAARAGIALAVLFVAKYLCFMYAMQYPMLMLLYLVGTLATPFVAYQLTKAYRALVAPSGAPFPFGIAWSHGTLLYFFATIPVLIPEYFYYQHIVYEQLPYLDSIMNASPYRDMLYQLYGGAPSEMMRKVVAESTPLTQAISSLSSALLWGGLLSLINAALLSRKPQNN